MQSTHTPPAGSTHGSMDGRVKPGHGDRETDAPTLGRGVHHTVREPASRHRRARIKELPARTRRGHGFPLPGPTGWGLRIERQPEICQGSSGGCNPHRRQSRFLWFEIRIRHQTRFRRFELCEQHCMRDRVSPGRRLHPAACMRKLRAGGRVAGRFYRFHEPRFSLLLEPAAARTPPVLPTEPMRISACETIIRQILRLSDRIWLIFGRFAV
jgi:hypothetical protein